MDLSIIIVNWNSVAYLEKCLESVYANTKGLDFEVIVVDNASFDGCGEMIARGFPEVKFVQSPANVGFARANNLGFAHSAGRNVLFLNPDTEVTAEALVALLGVLDRVRDAGVVGAKLLNSDDTVQTSCIQRVPSILNQALDAEILRDVFPTLRVWGTWPLLEKQRGPVAVDVVSGACMMLRRGVFEQVGLFNTDYFMYSEDVDLCFRLARTGFTNYYVDDATLVHHGGGSSARQAQSSFAAVMLRDSMCKFFSGSRGAAYAMVYRATVMLISIARCAILAFSLLFPDDRFRSALSRWAAVLRWAVGLYPHPSAIQTKG